MKGLPIRLRLTLAFSFAMGAVLAATGLFLSLQLRADLDRALDRGLRSRTSDVAALVQQADTGLREAVRTRDGGGPGVAQILDAHGRVFDATTDLPSRPLLSTTEIAAAAGKTLRVARSTRLGSQHPVRLLATPVHAQGRHLIIVVGAPLADRDRALANLHTLLLVGGPAALMLASIAGYALAAAALRPVESMRRRAASISAARLHQRLPLGSARDELYRLGSTLNAMLAKLQSALDRERAFTADASHEVRTPLTTLRTELALLRRDRPTGAELDKAIDSALHDADTIADILDDLLLLARSDSDSAPARGERLAVDQVLAAGASRSAAHRASGPRFTIHAPPGLEIHGDADQLERALANLLDNAVHHGAEPIDLDAELHGEHVELHVRDRGSGFPPEFIPRAFERFTRADPARGAGGAGLGLAIVQAIAHAHGGVASVANRSGGGADAWISIPRDTATAR